MTGGWLIFAGLLIGILSAQFYRRERTTALGYAITVFCLLLMAAGIVIEFG